MTGTEAKEAFDRSSALVKAGQYDEARKVALLPSDRVVIEARIEAAGAKTDHQHS